MQQNEVYTLYKNYTSDIMQALKEKIDENNKLKENILSTKFSSIGVGVYKIGNKVYATQEFYR